MVAVNSTMLPLGTKAPDFRLPDPSGIIVSLADFRSAPALLVIFMCNHCPYVKHIRDGLAKLARDYRQHGVAVVGINSNDVANYPADSPARMVEEATAAGYIFPYLYDETQAVAKAYRAACTPDLYLFDRDQRLAYRGQFDDSRPGNGVPVTGKDVRAALDALLAGKPVSLNQKPSIGCNIKWKPGNEPEYFLNLGIEIGGTKLQFVLGDDTGKICERRKLPVDPARGAAGIRQQIEGTLPELLRDRRILRAGVGFGGPVDWKTGTICRSHQIEGWSEFDLGGWLRQLAGAPVVIDNDANVAALGEAMRGAGVGFNPVFYVTLGSGVGGGLVVDGKIYHGAKPGEAEIGHVRLDRHGTIVEARCSGWAVDARIRELRVKEPESLLARMAGQMVGGEGKSLAAAWQQEDAAARRLLQQTAEDLAFGLSHVVHLLHPEVIILGGGLSGVGEPLRAFVEGALQQFMMEAFAPGPRIALAALGEDAVPVGALEFGNGERRELRIGLTRPASQRIIGGMNQWISDYIKAQKAAHDSIPVEAVAQLIEKLRVALKEDRQIFVFGNGGSAANASHFATDLGKLASDKVGKRFRVLSLNDNVGWLTALANDYAYEDVFAGQLQNYGKAGDLVLALSVSGNSPNCVKALDWAKKHGLQTVALVGARRGRMAEVADQAIVVNDTHYGRVEDAQMGICHMACYAFVENAEGRMKNEE